MDKRLKEISDRKLEIRGLLKDGKELDMEAIEKELNDLDVEERAIAHRMEIAGKINAGELRGKQFGKQEEKDPVSTDSMEYRKAFMAYCLRGTPIPVEYRIDAITATTDIAAAIPSTVLNQIIEKIEATGMILPLITRTAYKGGLAIPTSAVKPTATWVSQGAGSAKQEKTTGSVTFAYYKLRCAIAVTLEVDNMAISAFEAAFVNNVVEAMVKALEQAVISGVGNTEPTGILTETPPAGQALTGTPTYEKLIEAEGVLPLEYENGAVWVMTKKTFMSFVAETDADGQPIARVNYGIAGKPERVLLGRPVVLCNYLDSWAANLANTKAWAFLFDFKDYVLNTNYAMTIKKYEDDATDDLITKAIMLADGKVVDKNSLVTLKNV